MRVGFRGLVAVFLLTIFAACGHAQTIYAVDPATSTLEIDVYREGLLKVFGHDHLIAAKGLSGTAQFDASRVENSSVTLRVDAGSLMVVDPGQSAKDRSQVRATMLGDEVLDAARYPQIDFQSNSIQKAERRGDAWSVVLAGTLALHGVLKPITFPVRVRLAPNTLDAVGEVFLFQTAFGITPAKVAGGAVRVKDRVRVRFVIHALARAKA